MRNFVLCDVASIVDLVIMFVPFIFGFDVCGFMFVFKFCDGGATMVAGCARGGGGVRDGVRLWVRARGACSLRVRGCACAWLCVCVVHVSVFKDTHSTIACQEFQRKK